MTTVRYARNATEEYIFPLLQDSLPGSAPRTLAVVIRMSDCIDLLVLSGREECARLIPQVGEHIGDALDALIDAGLLPDTSAIMVIHHLAADVLASRQEQGSGECPVDSGWVRSLYDLQQSVREDVAFLRVSPLLLQDTEVSGLIYDVSRRLLFSVAPSQL